MEVVECKVELELVSFSRLSCSAVVAVVAMHVGNLINYSRAGTRLALPVCSTCRVLACRGEGD